MGLAGWSMRTRSCALPDGTERTFHADVVVLSTGSRPRIPEWAPVDGERVLSTRMPTRHRSCLSTSS